MEDPEQLCATKAQRDDDEDDDDDDNDDNGDKHADQYHFAALGHSAGFPCTGPVTVVDEGAD